MKRRASDAPLYAVCPAAAHPEPGEVCIHRIDDAGTFGTAIHEAGAHIVRGEEFDSGEICAKYELDGAARRRFLYQAGVAFKTWTKHRDWFCHDDGTLRVLDWKSTRLQDVHYEPQLVEYLYFGVVLNQSSIGLPPGLLIEESLSVGDDSGHPDAMFIPSMIPVKQCQHLIVFLEDGSYTLSEFITPDEILEAHDAYVESVENWDGVTYTDDAICHYCGRMPNCPGLQKQIVQTSRMLDGPDVEAALATLTPEQKIDLYKRIKMMIGFGNHCCDLIKMEARQAGDRLAGETRELVMNRLVKKPLNVSKAWPILKQHLTDEELASAISISKGSVMDVVRAKAPKKQGAAAIRKVTAELEEAGAFDERIEYRAQIKPITAPAEQQIDEGD